MAFMQEFKKFALRGNVVDMAVGIIIGAAFGKITSSLVSDVLMPPIGLLLGDVDFSAIAITLREASEGIDAVTINIGVFINAIIHFVIIAFAVFLLVKGMNNLARKEEQAPPKPAAPPKQEVLLEEIRDLLKK